MPTIRSFKVTNSPRNEKLMILSLDQLKQEKQIEAERSKQHCNIAFETFEGHDHIRVNIYDVNDGDIFRLGEIFHTLQSNPFK